MTTSTARRKVTVTFDNGPTPGITDGVLDVLAERGIRATFSWSAASCACPEAGT
jgi:peptidoglycan/xylan/chitin deacetylase (PgdA/CDA1 family)